MAYVNTWTCPRCRKPVKNEHVSCWNCDLTRESANRVAPGTQLGWWDRQFADATGWLVVAGAVMFCYAALPFGVLGFIFCKTPPARRNVLTIAVIGGCALLSVVCLTLI